MPVQLLLVGDERAIRGLRARVCCRMRTHADVCGRMLTYASLRSSFVPVQLLLVSDERAIRGLHASHRRLHRAYGYQ